MAPKIGLVRIGLLFGPIVLAIALLVLGFSLARVDGEEYCAGTARPATFGVQHCSPF